MRDQQTYRAGYDLERVVLYGAVGSCSVIFSALLVLFMGTRISSHPGFSTDTIGEMMDYFEFFFLAFLSYFSASVFTWRFREKLAKWTASWLMISFIGSIVFPILFLLRLWIVSVFRYQQFDSDGRSLGPFLATVVGVLLVGSLCFLLSAVCCGLVSAIQNARRKHNGTSIV